MQTSTRSLRQPSYRHHKASGQAVVTVSGRDVYLGKHGTPESKKAYKRLMLEFLEADGYLPAATGEKLLVSELCAAYKRFSKRQYVRDGESTGTFTVVAAVIDFLAKSPYGPTFAEEFGPLWGYARSNSASARLWRAAIASCDGGATGGEIGGEASKPSTNALIGGIPPARRAVDDHVDPSLSSATSRRPMASGRATGAAAAPLRAARFDRRRLRREFV